MACSDTTTNGCGPAGGPASLERVRYFPRQLLGPDDMSQEQAYFRARMRRHNRMLHGWGVACGCLVKPGDADWTVVIEPGYVLGPQGDEILIDEAVSVDLSRQDSDGNNVNACWGAPGLDPWCASVKSGIGATDIIYIAVAYSECDSRPVRVQAAGCGCDGSACEYSRIRDSFVVRALRKLPKSYANMQSAGSPFACPTIGVRECPECPEEPWVVLAQVKLGGREVRPRDIDNHNYRRYVASFGNWYLKCGTSGTALLKIDALRLLKVDPDNPTDPNATVLVNVTDPTQPVEVSNNLGVNALEVQFNEDVPVEFNSVRDGESFVVTSNVVPASGPPVPVQTVIKGKLFPTDTNAVRWLPDTETTLAAAARSYITVALKGTGPNVITSEQAQGGRPLDGEANKEFPSGDDREGGDFSVILVPSSLALLKVAGVRFIGMAATGAPVELARLENPQETLEFDGNPTTIEVRFTPDVPVDFRTINDATFVVKDERDTVVPGEIELIEMENAVRWRGEVPVLGTVTLKGSGTPSIKSREVGEAEAHVLDGEPRRRLPSGNGNPGGDFTFKFNTRG